MNEIINAEKLGNRIRSARTASGLTQAMLAAKIEFSTKYISNIECGAKVPKLDTLVLLANALNVDANSLLVDALNVAPEITSTNMSKKLSQLPQNEQQRLLHLFELMVEDAIKK